MVNYFCLKYKQGHYFISKSSNYRDFSCRTSRKSYLVLQAKEVETADRTGEVQEREAVLPARGERREDYRVPGNDWVYQPFRRLELQAEGGASWAVTRTTGGRGSYIGRN